MASTSPPRTQPDFSRIKSAKGAQARNKLLRAAERVLERKSFHQMRITDVTREAKVSTGLIYHYFPDLRSLIQEVLEEFVANFDNLELVETRLESDDWYGHILVHCQAVVDNYAEKPALMRCLLEITEEDAEFARLMRNFYDRQLESMAVLMPELFPDAGFTEEDSFLVLTALGGIGDNLLRSYFVDKHARLVATERGREELAEIIATLFYRGLFLQNPPEEKLRYMKSLTRMRLPEG